MSDFFASLAARNLGPRADVPATDADGVRPRPVAAFEPEGVGVPPIPPEPPAEAAEIEHPVTTAPIVPVIPDSPDASESEATASSDVADQPPSPPPAPMLAPVSADTVVITETALSPRSEDAGDAQEPVAQPHEAIPASEPDRTPPPPGPGREDVRDDHPALPTLRPGLSRRPADESDRARAAQPPPHDTAADHPTKRQRKTDAPLERIVRQMVLAPRPAPPQLDTQSNHESSDAITDPVVSVDRADSATDPLTEQPLPNRDPERAPPDIAPLRPQMPTIEPIQQLAPVPDTPPPAERRISDTTVRISIGRIEVRAGAAEPQAQEQRPAPPSPKLMSLDDYLRTRGTAAGS